MELFSKEIIEQIRAAKAARQAEQAESKEAEVTPEPWDIDPIRNLEPAALEQSEPITWRADW
jgi:hypothetical protein